ncbi:MAG TPA: YerC/YecD family TrpR-related protein [Candidatus Gracilibacteria bacterium]|nr:YerC/YecD family TrpR-related protein [Candidatus Gracilibacteria bacterium]
MTDKELNTAEAKELFTAISSLTTPEECKKFFRDLCTLSEINGMTERFQVAKRILNKESYRSISEATGASTTTVTRVAHWLHHGMGGYNLVLKKMK